MLWTLWLPSIPAIRYCVYYSCTVFIHQFTLLGFSLPVRCGEVFLLLELLLQAHELQLCEDGSAAARFLQARCVAVFRLRLAADAEGRLAGHRLRWPGLVG